MLFVVMTQEEHETQKTLAALDEYDAKYGKMIPSLQTLIMVIRTLYFWLRKDTAKVFEYSGLSFEKFAFGQNQSTQYQYISYHFSNICRHIVSQRSKGLSLPDEASLIQQLETMLESCRIHCSLTKFTMQNVGPFYYFLRAEYERFQGKTEESVQHYNMSVEYAKSASFLHHEAIVLESLAELHKEKDRFEIYEALISKAAEAFETWGAAPKANKLREELAKEQAERKGKISFVATSLDSAAAILNFLMKDEEGLIIFGEFLSLCFCRESLYFIQEVRSLREKCSSVQKLGEFGGGGGGEEDVDNKNDGEKRTKGYQEVCDTVVRLVEEYILPDSTNEINIDGGLRDRIRSKVGDALDLDFVSEDHEQEDTTSSSSAASGSNIAPSTNSGNNGNSTDSNSNSSSNPVGSNLFGRKRYRHVPRTAPPEDGIGGKQNASSPADLDSELLSAMDTELDSLSLDLDEKDLSPLTSPGGGGKQARSSSVSSSSRTSSPCQSSKDIEKKASGLVSAFDSCYEEIWSQLVSESIPRFVQTPEFNSFKKFFKLM